MLKISLCDALSFPNSNANMLQTASENSFTVRMSRKAKYLIFNCFLHADFAMLHVKKTGNIVWSQEIHFHGCDYHIEGPFDAGEQLEISLEAIPPDYNNAQLIAEISFTTAVDILASWSRGTTLGAVCKDCNYNRTISTSGFLNRILPDEVIFYDKNQEIFEIKRDSLYM